MLAQHPLVVATAASWQRRLPSGVKLCPRYGNHSCSLLAALRCYYQLRVQSGAPSDTGQEAARCRLADASASTQCHMPIPSKWRVLTDLLSADAGHGVDAHLAHHRIPHGAALCADGQLHATRRRADGLRPGGAVRWQPRCPQATWHIDQPAINGSGMDPMGCFCSLCWWFDGVDSASTR